jgi:hypothetical protein
LFGAAARFVEGIRFDRAGFERLSGGAASAVRPLVAYGLVGRRRALVWVKDDAFQWNSPEPATVADATLRIEGLARGAWCGRWYDTWAGAWRGRVRARSRGGAVELRVPAFERDLALRLRSCGP